MSPAQGRRRRLTSSGGAVIDLNFLAASAHGTHAHGQVHPSPELEVRVGGPNPVLGSVSGQRRGRIERPSAVRGFDGGRTAARSATAYTHAEALTIEHSSWRHPQSCVRHTPPVRALHSKPLFINDSCLDLSMASPITFFMLSSPSSYSSFIMSMMPSAGLSVSFFGRLLVRLSQWSVPNSPGFFFSLMVMRFFLTTTLLSSGTISFSRLVLSRR
mmetsp:Transcript_18091/g.60545  ORF Transcript_18091/g.60545 Transcript_18091/m.60545 type:complete len:215 (-) Transcript_18091:430-1074(-)